MNRLGASQAAALCARSLRHMARSAPGLAVEHALDLLQHCLLGLKLADGDPPGMGTCAQVADAIKVGPHLHGSRKSILKKYASRAWDQYIYALQAAERSWEALLIRS